MLFAALHMSVVGTLRRIVTNVGSYRRYSGHATNWSGGISPT
jgi:hypothetical protein